jgi:hypothetical protein
VGNKTLPAAVVSVLTVNRPELFFCGGSKVAMRLDGALSYEWIEMQSRKNSMTGYSKKDGRLLNDIQRKYVPACRMAAAIPLPR